jgi:hypothetical protein
VNCGSTVHCWAWFCTTERRRGFLATWSILTLSNRPPSLKSERIIGEKARAMLEWITLDRSYNPETVAAMTSAFDRVCRSLSISASGNEHVRRKVADHLATCRSRRATQCDCQTWPSRNWQAFDDQAPSLRSDDLIDGSRNRMRATSPQRKNNSRWAYLDCAVGGISRSTCRRMIS